MRKVAVLFGGKSGEHEVSLCSAASVVTALDKEKYTVLAVGISKEGRWYPQEKPEIIDDRDFGRVLAIRKNGSWLVNNFSQNNKLVLYNMENGDKVDADVVFPVLHGTYGEDGTVQGLLELAAVPYVGADVLGSSVGMDKDVAKRLLAQAGIPVVPWMALPKALWESESDALMQKAIEKLGLPLFVKPACAGSSVGIQKVKVKEAFRDAVDGAFLYDTRVLIEKAVDCREIECSVLGNENPAASVPGEIIPSHEFYSYDAKYIDPQGARLVVPAEIDKALSDSIRHAAVKGYSALGCSGMARVDFFLEKNSGTYYFNEINTIPGFTSISMYPKMWEATGLPYSELLDRLIDLAFDRHRKKMQIQTELIKSN